jgi:hypothetical protein
VEKNLTGLRLFPEYYDPQSDACVGFAFLAMSWFLNWLKSMFRGRRSPTDRSHLFGMYFNESNHGGRKKANRERA